MADLPTLRAKVEAARALAAKATEGHWAADVVHGDLGDRVSILRSPSGAPDDAGDLLAEVWTGNGADGQLMAAAPDLVTLATDLLVALEAAQAERDEARARAMRAEDAKKAAATAAAMDERAAIALWLERNNPIPGWQASPGGTKIGDYLASLFRRGVHRG